MEMRQHDQMKFIHIKEHSCEISDWQGQIVLWSSREENKKSSCTKDQELKNRSQ